jgi:phosphate transport system ATP-binding protein
MPTVVDPPAVAHDAAERDVPEAGVLDPAGAHHAPAAAPAGSSPSALVADGWGEAQPGLVTRPARTARREARQAPAQVLERLRLESTWLAYGERWVVRNVTLPVRQGEVLALIGASGSGKTTLLRSLNRLTEITEGASRAGRITLDGDEIDELEVNDLRRRVSMVFQQPNPFPMSVFENVAYPLREERSARRRRRRAGLPGRGPKGDELRATVIEALQRAGLYDEVADDLDRPALRLSGGQQQRLCIARSLAARPEVLLLDEPCSALDPISTATIEELIVGLRESVAIMIVTHNLQQAMRVADHVAFLHLGELVEYGPSEQVFGQPREHRTREYVSGAFG